MISCYNSFVTDDSSGTYLARISAFGATGNGFVFSPSSFRGQNVNGFFANSVLSDTSRLSAWVFLGDGPIVDMHLDSVWGGGSGSTIDYEHNTVAVTSASAGLAILNGSLDGLAINNSHFHSNGGAGILIGIGQRIDVGTGTSTLENNRFDAPGGGPGINSGIVIAAATNVGLIGIHSGTGNYLSDVGGIPNRQLYGVDLQGGTNIRVVASDVSGNLIKGIRNLGVAGVLIVRDNAGYSTEGMGRAMIPAGSACGLVNLGVDTPDATTFVQITPTGATSPYAAGATRFWVTPPSGGFAQFCGEAPVTAPVNFFWLANGTP